MINIMLKYPEVTKYQKIFNIYTTPLELIFGIDKYKTNDDEEGLGIHIGILV